MSEPVSAEPQNTWASAPFDASGKGDVILRTSDNVSFRAHRTMLSLSSSVFDDLFGIPQSPDTKEELPIITVSESSAVLQSLLNLIYPIQKTPITTFPLAFDVVTAADKYMVDLTIIAHFIGKELFSNRSVPLDAYALSWRLMLPQQAQEASRYLHTVNLDDPAVKSSLLTKSGTPESLLALWSLRHRRELALNAFMEAFPITKFRCLSHPYLTALETRQLRDAVRRALDAAPRPACTNVTTFFNLQSMLTGPKTESIETARRNVNGTGGSPGLFGSANVAPQAQAQATPVQQLPAPLFGFGGATNTAPAATNATPQPTPFGGNIFGNPQQPTLQAAATATAAPDTATAAPAAFGLFGGTPPAQTNGLFGASQRAAGSPFGCFSCWKEAKGAKSETVLAEVMRAIDLFPQEIICPKEHKSAW